MTQNIHPTAIIGEHVRLGQNVTIGPYCVLEGHVVLGDNVTLKAHVFIEGYTTIGENTVIYPYASIGTATQDKKFSGGKAELSIGKNNVIREYVTMNPGHSESSGQKTVVGDHCLFMVSAHVAHDCIVGNHVVMANNATLAGHVEVGDHAIIGGLSAVHQFVRIGDHAMIGGMAGVAHDVIPYGLVNGTHSGLSGLNLVGLKRRGFERDDIKTLREAYDLIFGQEGTFKERVAQAQKDFAGHAQVSSMIEFITTESSRNLCFPARIPTAA